MTDVIASEWLKLRTVRSSVYLAGAALLSLLVGVGVSYLMTRDWDRTPPAEQAMFEPADASLFVVPFATLCLAALAALAITSEYATGTIRPSLAAVPRRGAVLAAKALVVGATTLVVGQALALAAFLATAVVVGDRPPPIAPWASPSEALPLMWSTGLTIMAISLVTLGIGVVLRSTAGTLVTLCALLFVVPMLAGFLPAPWNARIGGVLLPALHAQLAGVDPDPLLSQPAAAAVMALHIVAALTAAALSLRRRDA